MSNQQWTIGVALEAKEKKMRPTWRIVCLAVEATVTNWSLNDAIPELVAGGLNT